MQKKFRHFAMTSHAGIVMSNYTETRPIQERQSQWVP